MAERNRQILASYELGEDAESLCAKHKLRPSTLTAILCTERLRREHSPLPVYRDARNQTSANEVTSELERQTAGCGNAGSE
jgi:hypothetical protein